MLKREEAIWLIIRAVGLNVLAFAVVAAISVAEYAVRLTSAAASIHLSYWYLGWSIVRLATHAAVAAYLLLAGSLVYRLIDRVVPTGT